ncbi:MAG TPA: hypothetical protein VLH56_08165 [Dissulfurispiraceae bacterium]|nr:hypothetical protein [Dissulfurispiraceae bacterium]
MMIRKFTGGSFKEALEQVKQELGDHAMILSSRSIKSAGFGLLNKPMVEVTAAAEDSGDGEAGRSSSAEMEEMVRELRSMREEMGFLKETLTSVMPGLRVGKEKKGLYNLLVKHGVDPQFAVVLLERSNHTVESIKFTISQDVKVQNFSPTDERGFLFLGTPGVGKTTMLSKIAHILRKKHKRLSLISLDSERISSFAHMKELSQELGCDLKVTCKVSDLPRMIYRDIERGPVLVDTPGYNYKKLLGDIADVFSSGFPLTRCLLMDAAMNTQAAERIWQNSHTELIDTIGFTKLDIAAQYGSLYNLSLLSGRPLSFISSGPSVPDDIQVPSPDYIASLIVGGACAN